MSDSAFAAVATRASKPQPLTWPWPPGPPRTPRSRDGRRPAGGGARDPRGQREPTSRPLLPPAPRSTCSTGCASTRSRVEGMAQGLRDVAALPDPVGEVGARLHPGQRPGAAAGAGAVRRGRHHLRGPAQRHRGRRRHLPEERQRGAAARLLQRASAPTRRSSQCCARRRGVRPARGRRPAGARGEPRLGQGADAGPRPGRRADPARRRRPDPLRGRGVDRAGDRDRCGQLPRLRGRRRRPRHGRADRAQLQDPPHLGVQRRRVAAGAPGRGRRRSCRASSGRSRTRA